MASITLRGVWLHDADDLSDHVELVGLSELTSPTTVEGEVRTYAGGRRLVRRRPGRHDSSTVTVRLPKGRVGLDWIRDHVGRTVMVRDFAGNVVWGVYWQVAPREVAGADTVDLTLSLDPVTVGGSA